MKTSKSKSHLKSLEFASLLQNFFIERLMQQRNASPRTIASYRDTFKLFFQYANDRHKKSAAKFTMSDFTSSLVLDFLSFLEKERKNTIRTRNARLTAIHSFARYVAQQCPTAMTYAQEILAIPSKRYEKPLLGFLSREEVQSILNAPDDSSLVGQRDRVMLAVLYNTGARVTELISIKVDDVVTGRAPSIRLHGKGRKQRTVPLWKETAVAVRNWIRTQKLTGEQPLLPNRLGGTMTRANVAERINIAVDCASSTCKSLRRRSISPHTFRHATAMHMLQSGVSITVIAVWLGHESPVSTHAYIEADLAMKQRALNSVSAPKVGKNRYQPHEAILEFLDSL
jgi:integrase/recombinase XerD